MASVRDIESEIAIKLKKLLDNEFDIFCKEYRIDRYKLIYSHRYTSKVGDNMTYYRLLSLYPFSDELQTEWNIRECKILIPFFLRYLKINKIGLYCSIRYRMYNILHDFTYMDAYRLYFGIMAYNHSPILKCWYNDIYLVAAKVE